MISQRDRLDDVTEPNEGTPGAPMPAQSKRQWVIGVGSVVCMLLLFLAGQFPSGGTIFRSLAAAWMFAVVIARFGLDLLNIE